MTKPIKIIQASPPQTASTVLCNILYGLIEPLNVNVSTDFNSKIVKTHETNIQTLMNKYSDKYDLYFVCSERNDDKCCKLICDIYRTYENVIIFNFNELNDHFDKNNTEKIVQNAYKRLKTFLPSNLSLNVENAEKRIKNMNKICEDIKNKPFKFYNKQYHIHGSHRNRL